MLVSVVIPACDAQSTIGRAIRSLIDQTWGRWEAVIVADDGFDYEAFVRTAGVGDPRLRFVSTGRVRSGCHNARNVGLAAARGDLIAALDADDLFYPERIEKLASLVQAYGAATDNPAAVLEAGGEVLYRALGAITTPLRLSVSSFLDTSVPLFPIVRRFHAEPRLAGI